MSAPTFRTVLRQMQRDMRSIVTRMNLDGNEDIAHRAQDALRTIREVEKAVDGAFNSAAELAWDWKPNDVLDREDDDQ